MSAPGSSPRRRIKARRPGSGKKKNQQAADVLNPTQSNRLGFLSSSASAPASATAGAGAGAVAGGLQGSLCLMPPTTTTSTSTTTPSTSRTPIKTTISKYSLMTPRRQAVCALDREILNHTHPHSSTTSSTSTSTSSTSTQQSRFSLQLETLGEDHEQEKQHGAGADTKDAIAPSAPATAGPTGPARPAGYSTTDGQFGFFARWPHQVQ